MKYTAVYSTAFVLGSACCMWPLDSARQNDHANGRYCNLGGCHFQLFGQVCLSWLTCFGMQGGLDHLGMPDAAANVSANTGNMAKDQCCHSNNAIIAMVLGHHPCNWQAASPPGQSKHPQQTVEVVLLISAEAADCCGKMNR